MMKILLLALMCQSITAKTIDPFFSDGYKEEFENEAPANSMTREKRQINFPGEKDYTTTDQGITFASPIELDWKRYNTYQEIDDYILGLCRNHTQFTKCSEVATTYENRTVRLIKVTAPSSSKQLKKKIWIEAGIHAREWIAPAVATYLLDMMLNTGNQLGEPLRKILAQTEWYIVPLANPDGYAFSHKPGERLWRKNRSVTPGSKCVGVDLNRNWGTGFGIGASDDPCHLTYKGRYAFSEKETSGLKAAMSKIDKIYLFLSLHSFGQYVLYPFGFTHKELPNVWALKEMGSMFTDMIARLTNNQTTYKLMSSSGLGLASGASDDWTYDALKVPLSYTIELPPESSNNDGFELPENQILYVAKRTGLGIYCMGKFLIGENCFRN